MTSARAPLLALRWLRGLLLPLVVGACADAETNATDPGDGACGDALPAEGSLCDMEGQKCAPDQLGCGLYTGVECKGGVWVHYEVGTGQCTGTDPGTHSGTEGEPTGTTGDAAVACGDEVPHEGTPCADEGEDCAPDANPCAGYVGAQCSGGRWMRYTVEAGDPSGCEEPVSCAADTPVGSACVMSGELCTPDCAEVCAPCSGLKCEAGVWQEFAAPPCGPDCEDICAAMLAPMCEEGPADTDACEAQCAAQLRGRCRAALQEALACAGEPLMFTCDGADRPTVAGCEAQFEALQGCSG